MRPVAVTQGEMEARCRLAVTDRWGVVHCTLAEERWPRVAAWNPSWLELEMAYFRYHPFTGDMCFLCAIEGLQMGENTCRDLVPKWAVLVYGVGT